jgi:hypothetical protein
MTGMFGTVVLPGVAAVMLTLLIGYLLMPALNIFRVNARGLGDEHASPWRARLNSFLDRLGTAASTLHRAFERASRHWLFRPAVAFAALMLAILIGSQSLMAAPFVFGALTEGQHAGEFIVAERPGVGYPSRENTTVLSGQNLKAGAVVGRVTRGVGRVSVPAVVGTGNGTVSQVFGGPEVLVGNYVVTCTAAVADGGVFSVVAPDGNALPSLTMTPGAGGTTKYRSRHINFSITDGASNFIVNDVFTFVVSTTAPTVQGGTGTGTISAIALGPDAQTGNYRAICTAAVANGGVFQVYRGGPDGGDSIGTFTMTPGAGGATIFETRHLTFTLTDNADFIVGNFFDICVFKQLAGGKAVEWDPTTFDGRQTAVGALYDNVNATASDLAGVIITRDAEVLKGSLQWNAAITASQKESAYLDLALRGIIAR